MFAGTMIGVTLTFANVGGFLTPILTGFITDGNVIPPCSKDHRVAESTVAIQNATFQPTLAAWRTVFLITAGFYLVCNTLYVFLMVAEVQSWAMVKQDVGEEHAKAEPPDSNAK